MAFKRKCKYCGKFIADENDAVEYKEGYVHSACFSIALKVVQDKRVEKASQRPRKAAKPETVKIPKKGMSEEEHQSKTEYFNYVKNLLGGVLPAKIFAVTERYMELYKDRYGQKWTYPKMQQTLLYCKEVLGKDMNDDCIGLLRFYYDEADEYYNQISKFHQNITDSMDAINATQTRIVKINPHAKKEIKQLNIEEIGVNAYE